jgi:Cytochrome P450
MLATSDNLTPALPTAESARDLPFLDAVVHEGLRCFPPVAPGVVGILDREVNVNGALLPKGTLALLPIWAVHYSEEAWGLDAGEWRPGRWLEGRSVNAVKKDKDGNPRWMPFSHGAQSCIGQHLAMVRSQPRANVARPRACLRWLPRQRQDSAHEAGSVVHLHASAHPAQWLPDTRSQRRARCMHAAAGPQGGQWPTRPRID